MLQRGADAVAQWLYVLDRRHRAGPGIAWVCAGLCVVLLCATRTLGKGFETRQRAEAGEPASAT